MARTTEEIGVPRVSPSWCRARTGRQLGRSAVEGEPLQRAARWDGIFPIELPGPDALAELVAEVRALRDDVDGFDFVVEVEQGQRAEPWEQAGATWLLTGFDLQPRLAEVRAVIEAGPREWQ